MVRLVGLTNQISQAAGISKVVSKFEDRSLRFGTKKQKSQFAALSKSDKRTWRESLQRAINAVRNNCFRKALAGFKIRGKTKGKIDRTTRVEQALIDALDDSRYDTMLQYQAGVTNAAIAVGVGGIAYAANVAARAFTTGAKAVDKGVDVMSDLLERFHAFVGSLAGIGEIMKKIAIGLVAFWVVKRFCHAPVIVAAISAAAVAYVSEIKDMLDASLGRFNEITHQDGLISNVSDIVALACTVCIPGKDAKTVTGEFMKRASYFPRASEGIEKFIEKALKLIEELLNFCMRRSADTWITLGRKLSLYDVWRKKVAASLKDFASRDAIPISELKDAKQLLVEGYGFLEIMATAESKKDVSFWIERLRIALQPHQGALTAANNIRAMPYCMIFGGGSGVGKTTLVRLVAACTLMLAGECKASEALANMWQKGTTEYWNGYAGQKCLIMDDCFQVKPKAGDPDSEAMQVIRAIGNWSYPLNFADVESKGRFYLNTPLVIGTTNCHNVKAEWEAFITCPEALIRRFQGAYWVDVDREYQTAEGRFDYDRVAKLVHERAVALVKAKAGAKLSTDEVMDLIPWEVWTLRNHRFDSTNVSPELTAGGLRSAVETAAREMRRRREGNAGEIADLQDILNVLGAAVDDGDIEPQAGFSAGLKNVSMELVPDIVVPEITEFKPLPDSKLDQGFADFIRKTEVRLAPGEPTFGVDFSLYEEADRANVYARAESEACAQIGRILQKQHEEMIAAETFLQFTYRRFTEICSGIVNTIVDLLPSCISRVVYSTGLEWVATNVLSFAILTTAFSLLIPIITGAVRMLWGFLQTILNLLGISSAAPVEHESGEGTVRPRKEDGSLVRWQCPSIIEHQVGVPPNEKIHEHLFANTLKCYVDSEPLGQFIGIGATVYVFPRHFLEVLRKCLSSSVMVFHACRDETRFEMTVSDFLKLQSLEMSNSDIAAVSFGPYCGIKACRQIVHYFLRERDIAAIFRGSNTPVRLDIADFKNGRIRQTTHSSPTCETAPGVVIAGRSEAGIVKYTAPTVKGDCGAPLSMAENRHYGGRCVIGFHTAGRDNRHAREGYGTVVTAEVAQYALDRLKNYSDTVSMETPIQEEIPFTSNDLEHEKIVRESGLVAGSMQYLGKFDNPIHMGTRTSLCKSLMQEDEVFGSAPSRPAILSPVRTEDGVVYPMVQAMKAYQSPISYSNPDELAPIVTLAMKKHWEATRHYPKYVLSFDEALVPPEGWKFKSINRRSSAGAKYRQYTTPAYPGKTWFLGHDGEVDLARPQLKVLRDDVEGIISAARQGVRRFHLFTDFLKDELRPHAKVDAVMTRGISGSELDYTIAVRMYFGSYLAAMLDTYVKNGMAPGINFYKEWFMLADSLKNIGEKMFDGDFSRFDSSEQPWVHGALLRYVNEWYRQSPDWKPEDDKIRAILWLDLVHSRHLTGTGCVLDTVVQWNKSLPSGHPLTTMVNSMYSLVTLTGCYVKATNDMTHMWDHVYMCTFGDDNLSAVDDTVCEVFNQVTVAQHMKEIFDLTYTSGRKDVGLVPYTTLDKVTFLKRSFLKDEDGQGLIACVPNVGWVAPLDLNSFLYEGYWFKNAKNMHADVTTRIEHCICELALHPQELWDKYFPMIRAWCDKRDYECNFLDRAAARLYIKTRFDVWF